VTYHYLDAPVEFKRQALMSREVKPPAGTPGPVAEADPIAQLERLGALREKGVVSEAEFQATKAELLKRVR